MIEGTLEQVDGRPALRFTRRLSHPVERVWRAVTTYEDLAANYASGWHFHFDRLAASTSPRPRQVRHAARAS
jgi:hypothetical protein